SLPPSLHVLQDVLPKLNRLMQSESLPGEGELQAPPPPPPLPPSAELYKFPALPPPPPPSLPPSLPSMTSLSHALTPRPRKKGRGGAGREGGREGGRGGGEKVNRAISEEGQGKEEVGGLKEEKKGGKKGRKEGGREGGREGGGEVALRPLLPIGVQEEEADDRKGGGD
ncbi:hypothetical protein Naga_100693g1, partial [Nannochloropsis gaditana]